MQGGQGGVPESALATCIEEHVAITLKEVFNSTCKEIMGDEGNAPMASLGAQFWITSNQPS